MSTIKPDAPIAFLAKMQGLLGSEFAEFEKSYHENERTSLRVNTLKVSVADFIKLAPFALTPVGEYEPAGFFVRSNDLNRSEIAKAITTNKPGSHPYHAAGLYYLQEPAAMSVAALLRPNPGEMVLDLCAAPGGKTTHLAALMQDTGLLVANDVDHKRAWLLAENLERWGTHNTLILNDTPEHIATTFGPIFDRVLVDAPCSGEGMFRKKGAFEWSDKMVLACSRRQTGVLESAARLVRPGGRLIYSTCTFSPEENEQVIGRFLHDHTDFELVELPQFAGFEQGRPEWGWMGHGLTQINTDLRQTVRLWPHKFPGEGHFIALLQRHGFHEFHELDTSFSRKSVNLALWHEFADRAIQHSAFNIQHSQVVEANGRFYLLPEITLNTGSLRLVRYGLWLGEGQKGYFKPAHTLALALKANEVQETADFAADSSDIRAYLSGQDIISPGKAGWVLVTVDGFSLGWGKRVNGRLKNHYPKGLRH